MSSRELLVRLPQGTLVFDIGANGPITTGAWLQLTAALPSPVLAVTAYYNGEGILQLAKGAPGSEVALPFLLSPGEMGEEMQPLELPKGVRLAAKALDQNATQGRLVLKLYG